MDGTEPPSTSKVIVECIDPYNLFNSIEPHLSARTPLRNLHWKSPNRPLRSIPFLDVSLVRQDTSDGSQSNIRRHQIPGLRQTPYVKLYLLRCDDKETYNEKVRKEVRHWIKTQTSAAESKSSARGQENHDAFEWLIVHVVLPGTAAASQPKSVKHISLETADSTDSVNSKSKWPGKGSSTVFDKLKADFNSASKAAINRVAQVRLVESKDKSTALTRGELEEQWQDLVESLKACILRSFDARVAQYEGDIRERDSQRNLPGWNFCTFFILKEGLAKGFESVGLLDDALAIYDELSLGLDSLVEEQAQSLDHDENGALLRFSKETKELLRAALGPQDASTTSKHDAETISSLGDILQADRDAFPFDIDRKNYLGLILSNEVSAFDLRVYIFTRQMEILFRQGRAEVSRSSHTTKALPDPIVIADIAERAVQSINMVARNLRLELYSAWGGQEGLSAEELQSQRTVTGNIVSTWQWRACMQILARILPTLGVESEYGTASLSVDAVELSRHTNVSFSGKSGTDGNTQRMSLAVTVRPYPHEGSQERNKRASFLPDGAVSRNSILSRPGSERLALWTSALAMLARRALENIEGARSWVGQMKQFGLTAGIYDDTVQTNGQKSPEHVSDDDHPQRDLHQDLVAGLGSKSLQAAASSKSMFWNLYALLSVLAYRMAAEAKSHATAEQILTNLTEMEYAQGNHTIAARYLHSLLGPLPRPVCRPVDGYLLRIYADCLSKLEKTTEYGRCLISCLHWAARCCAGAQLTKSTATYQSYSDRLFGLVGNMAATTLPLTTLFRILSVSQTISKIQGRDGFAMSMVIHSLAGVATPPADDIKMRLVSKEGAEPRFLALRASNDSGIHSTGTNIVLEGAVTTFGWYTPDEVELRFGNLRLLHHFLTPHNDESAEDDELSTPRSIIAPVLVYPFSESFDVRISHSRHIHLAQTRRLLVEILPGANEAKQCKLRLKTATAGLRLNIHDAQLLGGVRPSAALRTAREGDALVLIVDDLEPDSLTQVEIPYTTEIASEPSVTLRIDANYETSQGVFTMYGTALVNVILPVTVNVQDISRTGCMYSRFTISPATLVPLRLLDCHLEDNKAYTTTVGHDFLDPLVVFPKQPASWVVRLAPKNAEALKSAQRLTLSVDFQSLDEVMLVALEDSFKSAISKTQYAYAARLLVAHLQNRIRAAWTEQDLEVAGLSQEVEIWDFDDMDWPSVLRAFDRQTCMEIMAWLQTWHSGTQPIWLPSNKARQRQLQLHVDIPPPPLVVSAVFEMNGMHITRGTAALGQPLMTVLVMSLGGVREEEVEGAFEVTALSDSWLIGGKRKGNVRLTAQPTRMPIVLFPQHLGHLLLPIVNVKCRKQVKIDGDGEEGWTEIPCEVHDATHGCSILVTPALRSTTVEVFGAIPNEGMGRLMASERR
ncbi:hypothetical protein A1O1_01677 [Capronia coronata CBS 617.96]|uniref:Trafficking protein particle complex subunit 10 n=1 Tax=Capronia coronata CBS 617.96 TaxID=1182541 RepID=W9YUB3_9EURO|nr:uncharacterized protein A1O1_01677 [Capronia coronata CBS 617.96]EXJ93285.1 hypothetical protein A1O1_01677 [Capronia coronata CBS 617.96]